MWFFFLVNNLVILFIDEDGDVIFNYVFLLLSVIIFFNFFGTFGILIIFGIFGGIGIKIMLVIVMDILIKKKINVYLCIWFFCEWW